MANIRFGIPANNGKSPSGSLDRELEHYDTNNLIIIIIVIIISVTVSYYFAHK